MSIITLDDTYTFFFSLSLLKIHTLRTGLVFVDRLCEEQGGSLFSGTNRVSKGERGISLDVMLV